MVVCDARWRSDRVLQTGQRDRHGRHDESAGTGAGSSEAADDDKREVRLPGSFEPNIIEKLASKNLVNLKECYSQFVTRAARQDGER